MGLTLHVPANFRRRHCRSEQVAGMGLNILLVATFALFAAGSWIASWIFVPAVICAMLYVLAAFVVRK